MKILAALALLAGFIAISSCAPVLAGGAAGEVMCIYQGLENVPASDPRCVAPPPPPPPPPPACQYNPTILASDPACVKVVLDAVTIMAPIYFSRNQYGITGIAAKTMRRNLRWLQNNPGMRIRIEGNAEDPGSDDVNLALAFRRAEAAKAYLVGLGIDPSRFDIVSYGRERPVCTEKTESCRNDNRRADFRIVTIGADRIVDDLPGGSPLSSLDAFPWPPPNPSKWMRLPPRLCNDPVRPTIGGSWEMIRAAFSGAHFPETERTFQIPPDGFAMVGQMEAIDANAQFKPDPDRWATPETPRIGSSSLADWVSGLINDLFEMGRYRIIVIAVTNQPSRGPRPILSSDTIKTLLTARGEVGELSNEAKRIPLAPATNCFALVYEFERPADPKKTRVKVVTRAQAERHLVLAKLWTPEQLRLP